MSLPPPAPDQAYCDVSVLEAGIMDLPLEWVIDTAKPSERATVPVLCFALRRTGHDNELFVFDLGLSKTWRDTTPGFGARLSSLAMRFVLDVPQDAADALARGGARPEDVTHVCLSHAHFDHTGDPRPFVNATFVVGEGTRALVENGYPKDPRSDFPADLLPEGRTVALRPDEWPPLGPFGHALDFWGDGSLYIVDAGDGHLPGHINVLARTSSDGGWVYLAGDSAHDWRLLTGEAGIPSHHIFGCVHRDKEKAEAHLATIRAMMQAEPRVRVLLAHDQPWWEENKDTDAAFWPNKLKSL